MEPLVGNMADNVQIPPPPLRWDVGSLTMLGEVEEL